MTPVRQLTDRQSTPLLIRQAQLLNGAVVDVRIAGGVITEMASRLAPSSGERSVEAGGGLLIPGLHDHHLHLFATAAAQQSLHCGPPQVNTPQQLGTALEQCARQGEGWVRGVMFHHSVCEGIDRHWLDAVCPHRPVRIQHRSGMLWILNTNALEQLAIGADEVLPEGAERGADGELNGCFYNLDHWLGARMTRVWPSLRKLSAELAAFGVTAVTDTGANNDRATWQALVAASQRGELRQRLLVMGTEALNGLAPAAGGQVSVGPLKIYLREVDLPPLDRLVARMAAAHQQGRKVAVHCVTRVELIYALAALREAGARVGDRIEHAAIADDAALDELASLGVTVVTQPHFIAERGDQYRAAVDSLDQPFLYRGAGFVAGGVALAAGSDAPYGSLDPWAAMAAAQKRLTREGVMMGADEVLTAAQSLALYGGDSHNPGAGLRPLAVGQPADLCLLAVSWPELCADFAARHVAVTLCEGEITYAAAAYSELSEP